MEEKINLVDYISVERLQKMQESFSELVGVGVSISDENGSAITSPSGMCDFCKYTRVSRVGSERCRNCDSRGAELAFEEGRPVYYTCHAGLVDFVAPIVVDGRRVGCFVGGQVRLGDPDEARVLQTARDIGVNPMMYLALAKNTPMLTEDRLKKAMNLIDNVTLSISDMAGKQYQLEKAKIEVEYAAKLKSDFLANMSHEIRTPMNGVIGLTELALKDEIPEQTREYLDQIRTSGRGLLTIINDILDFSKIEAGKMNIVEEEYNPKDIFADVENMMAVRIGEKGLEFNVNYDEDIPKILIGDSIRIKQVLLNLVNNAVKFTDKGSVSISAKLLRTEDKTADIKISVADTGIGITEENLRKLFFSFEQVDSKRNRQAEGTGLGLAISKQLCELMGGEIGVESTYGEGSVFWFTLPQKVSDTALKGSAKDSGEFVPFLAPNARILIVDDNDINLLVAAGLLEPLKVHIDTASSGKQTLEMIENCRYDLIFMDHMMPEMDGVETTRIIRSTHPDYKDVPIIAFTANVIEDSREMFLKEGMNDCVLKPANFKTLAGMLCKWLPEEKKTADSSGETAGTGGDGTIHIDGLDTGYALGLLGSESLYMTVLKDYLRVIDSKADSIEAFYDSGDWKNYTIAVHALKSASRQIGALELSDLAAQMERAGNEGDTDTIHDSNVTLVTMYRNLKNVLGPLFEKDEASDKKAPVDADLVKEYLDALSEAIEDLDMDAMAEQMEKITGFAFEDEATDTVDALQTAVDNIDVDTAAELVEKLRSML